MENRDGVEQWCAPSEDGIKVNTNAAIFTDHHKFGMGFVARDNKGLLIEGCTRLCHGQNDSLLVEAMGMREVLSWIKGKQWSQVYIESD